MSQGCVHCGGVIPSTRGWFCSTRCRVRAYRRRKAGLAQDAYPDGALRGRVAMGERTVEERRRTFETLFPR